MNGTRTDRAPGGGRRAAHRGFTLVELMTVIVILTILIAIGAPAIVAARRQFRIDASRSLFGLIEGACRMYQADWKEYPPSASAGGMTGKQRLVEGLTGYRDDDGQAGWGARKTDRGPVYGPYNGAEHLETVSTATGVQTFIDAFGNEIYYWRFEFDPQTRTGSYNADDNDAGRPANFAALILEFPSDPRSLWRRDFLLMSRGPDGQWDSAYVGNPKHNDITNFFRE